MTKGQNDLNLSPDNCKRIIEILTTTIKQYKIQKKCRGFLVSTSGGLVSSFAMALCSLASESHDQRMALFMPTLDTASESYDLSELIASTTQFSLHTIPIKFIISTIKTTLREQLADYSSESMAQQIIDLRHLFLSTFAREKNLLHIHCMTKNDQEQNKFPPLSTHSHVLCPFGTLFNMQIRQLSLQFNENHHHLIPEPILKRKSLKELPNEQEISDPELYDLNHVDKRANDHAFCEKVTFGIPTVKITT